MLNTLLIAVFTITAPQAEQIGKKIWENESHGKIDGLTCWNEGEEFASLGINHFVWYPEGKKGPFVETFPSLIAYLQKQGVQVPPWLVDCPPCPWKSRKEFIGAFESQQMVELRRLLYKTASHQIQFMAEKLDKSLPKMLDATTDEHRDRVKSNYQRLLKTPKGPYILLDYYNFKGEGTSPAERYNEQGWGLLQVLEEMSCETEHPDYEFSQAAKKVLKRRVENAPPQRHEEQWLKGWIKRVKTYE